MSELGPDAMYRLGYLSYKRMAPDLPDTVRMDKADVEKWLEGWHDAREGKSPPAKEHKV